MTLHLKITYTNGKTLEQLAHYAHIEDGKLHFTVAKQVHECIQDIVSIPLNNIEVLDITPSEKKWM